MSYKVVTIKDPMYQCILPFSTCPYRVTSLGGGCGRRYYCEDIDTGPGNSDAGCFKLAWKKDMIFDSRLKGTPLRNPED